MRIEPGFVFSANSLQDYLDCPRRFELRYLLKLAWPAVESEPALKFEKHMLLGKQFHQLAQQYLNGIESSLLTENILDSDLSIWFGNWLGYIGEKKFKYKYIEFPLRAVIGDFQIMAVYDLIATTEIGGLLILDWKTSIKIPKKENLAQRAQTMLYPYVAAEAVSRFIPEESILPQQVQMEYVFVSHSDLNTIGFSYTPEQHISTQQYLQELIHEITMRESGEFESCQDERRCKFCVYRSLCERGELAGSMDEIEEAGVGEDSLLHLDFDFQDEIAF